jgi:mannose-6-phosphate isomerase
MPTPAILAPEPGAATLKERPWGGFRLAALRGGDLSSPIGESWEFSTLEGSESRSDGRTLRERLGHDLPFLAKLIDTELPLSVQVHPDDGTTDPRGAPIPGKEEAWIILEAAAGAELMVGLRAGLSAGEFSAAALGAIDDPTREAELLELLVRIPAIPGSIVLVPAGTVHAIGPGIMLAEIQQASDCTYRLYDYGSPREIHPELALETTRLNARPQTWIPGDELRTLRGKHIDLRVLGHGAHREPERGHEQLIIQAKGAAQLSSDAGTEVLMQGDLRLATGPEFMISPEPGAVTVLGRVRP